MSEVGRRLLQLMRQRREVGLPRSRVPTSCEPLMRELLTCGAVRWQAAGGGQIAKITDLNAFDAVVKRHFPMGLEERLSDVVDRATAVLATGDAKRARCGAYQGVFVRSARRSACVRSPDGARRIPVGELTRSAGGAALLLEKGRGWSFTGTVGVIENAEAFWRHEEVLDVDLAVYTAGRMSSRRLLQWLASPDMESCQFVHWGDYDPVGAAEYLRLQEACPGRVHMHLPSQLEELTARYGNRELLLRQVELLERLRSFRSDPVLATLLRLWEEHQRALEQEILLVARSDSVRGSKIDLGAAARQPSSAVRPLPDRSWPHAQ